MHACTHTHTHLLCYFASFQACQQLSPQTIKAYLAGVRYMSWSSRVTAVLLLTPLETSAVWYPAHPTTNIPCQYPPQTSHHTRHPHQDLKPLKPVRPLSYIHICNALCFSGFFHSGEITLPSAKAFDQSQHLAWEDIAIDDTSMLNVHLKKSKLVMSIHWPY